MPNSSRPTISTSAGLKKPLDSPDWTCESKARSGFEPDTNTSSPLAGFFYARTPSAPFADRPSSPCGCFREVTKPESLVRTLARRQAQSTSHLFMSPAPHSAAKARGCGIYARRKPMQEADGIPWSSGDYHGQIKETKTGPTLVLDGASAVLLTKRNNARLRGEKCLG